MTEKKKTRGKEKLPGDYVKRSMNLRLDGVIHRCLSETRMAKQSAGEHIRHILMAYLLKTGVMTVGDVQDLIDNRVILAGELDRLVTGGILTAKDRKQLRMRPNMDKPD